MVHVADPLYFDALQRLLDEAYDVVLYEAVKPADLSVVDWQRQAAEKTSSISGFQQEIASWFGFVFQLAALDYDRSHFVHADMTTEAFREAGGDELLGEVDPGAPQGSCPTVSSGPSRPSGPSAGPRCRSPVRCVRSRGR